MTAHAIETSHGGAHVSLRASDQWTATRVLVACGVVYALSYAILNDAIAAPIYGGYSWRDQAVSELSAKGASTRTFLLVLFPIWSALLFAFGIGIWRAARGQRSLRALGAVIAVHGLWSLAWILFPMSSRAAIAAGDSGANDTGHLVLSAMTGIFAMTELALAAASFGRRFRIYAAVSAVVTVVFAMLVSSGPSRMEDGKTTPWMGLFERITIVTWLVFLATLAVALLRQSRTSAPG